MEEHVFGARKQIECAFGNNIRCQRCQLGCFVCINTTCNYSHCAWHVRFLSHAFIALATMYICNFVNYMCKICVCEDGIFRHHCLLRFSWHMLLFCPTLSNFLWHTPIKISLQSLFPSLARLLPATIDIFMCILGLYAFYSIRYNNWNAMYSYRWFSCVTCLNHSSTYVKMCLKGLLRTYDLTQCAWNARPSPTHMAKCAWLELNYNMPKCAWLELTHLTPTQHVSSR